MVLSEVLLGFTLIWISDATYDLAPRERCVLTATASGACHVCVCGIDGVYHCTTHSCQISNVIIKQQKRECEPNRSYQHDATLCTCNTEGYWISGNCREKFMTMKPNSHHPMQRIQTNIECTPNSLYLLDCNVCECGPTGVIELTSCTNRRCRRGNKFDACNYGDILRTHDELCSCSDINLYIDRLCLKVKQTAIQAINRSELESIIEIEKKSSRSDEVYLGPCVPGSVMIFNCNRCFCTIKKIWGCTLKGCVSSEFKVNALRSHKQEDKFKSVATLKNMKGPCKPGKKYRYKCNSCVCSKKGLPICTSMVCLEDLIMDRSQFEESYQESFRNTRIE